MRVASALGGLMLVLLGLGTVSMCGPNRHIPGALIGALGGVAVGLVRKSRRLKWFATVGGLVGGGGVVGFMMALQSAGCDDLLFGSMAGLAIGFGIGLIADAPRMATKPREPDPPTA